MWQGPAFDVKIDPGHASPTPGGAPGGGFLMFFFLVLFVVSQGKAVSEMQRTGTP